MTAALVLACVLAAMAVCIIIGFWCGAMAERDTARWGAK